MGGTFGFPPEQLRALADLSGGRVASLYLAGGTAVAAHLRHRVSNDLDLFTFDANADLDVLTRVVVNHLPLAQVVSQSEVAATVRVGTLAVDIVRYPFPLLEPATKLLEGFPTAGLLDLAVMKLAAIARRGLRRDFWDLYTIVTESDVALVTACHGYRARYGVAQSDLYHVLRSLTFFDDTESEPLLPRGLTSARWERIRRFFREQTPTLVEQLDSTANP